MTESGGNRGAGGLKGEFGSFAIGGVVVYRGGEAGGELYMHMYIHIMVYTTVGSL